VVSCFLSSTDAASLPRDKADCKYFSVTWQSVQPTWNDGSKIRCVEENNEENGYSLYLVTTETQWYTKLRFKFKIPLLREMVKPSFFSTL
jgi:hypothetical protein